MIERFQQRTRDGVVLGLLPFVVLPAAVICVYFPVFELSWIVALIYLYPASQLYWSIWWNQRYSNYARNRLAKHACWPPDDEAIYTRNTYGAVTRRYYTCVLGTSTIECDGLPTGVIGASVSNELPFDWGKSSARCEAHTRRIGTGETLFLPGLFYVYLFAVEYYYRLHPEWTLDLIANSSKNESQPAELLALDRYARRIGQWFRNCLDADRQDAQVFAKTELYLSNIAETMRAILSVPLQRGNRHLDSLSSKRFRDVLIRIGATPAASNIQGDLENNTTEEITSAVSEFAKRFHLTTYSPYWMEFVAIAPRLILLALFVSQLAGLQDISTGHLLWNHMSNGGHVTLLSILGLSCGVVGLGLSTWSLGPDRFMRCRESFSLARFHLTSQPGRVAMTTLLGCGVAGSLLGTPGVSYGIPGLNLSLPYFVICLLFSLELLCVTVTNNSLVGLGVRYHFGPSAVLGSPRLILFYFLQYVLFFVVGTIICVHVIPYFDGWLLHVAESFPTLRQDMSLPALVGFTLLAATLGLLGLLPFRGNRNGNASIVHDVYTFAWLTVVCGIVLIIPFLGAIAVGGMMLLIALCLMNHAVFTLIVGVTALATELGRGRRPLLWAAWTFVATLLALYYEASLQELSAGNFDGSSVWSLLARPSWIILAIMCGEAALAFPLGLLGLVALSPFATEILVVAIGSPSVSPFQLFCGLTGIAITIRWRTFAFGLLSRRRRRWTKHGTVNGESQHDVRLPLLLKEARGLDSRTSFPHLAICLTGGQRVSSPALQSTPEEALAAYMNIWDEVIVPNQFPGAGLLVDRTGETLTRDAIKASLAFTFQREWDQGRSLWGEEAIVVGGPKTQIHHTLQNSRNVRGEPASLLFVVDTMDQADLLRQGLRIQQYIVSRTAIGGSQRDSLWYLVRLARMLRHRQLTPFVTLYVQSNKYTNARKDVDFNPSDPDPQHLFCFPPFAIEFEERLGFVEYIRLTTGMVGEVSHNHTFDSIKSGAQNGSSGSLHDATHMYVLDRNAHSVTIESVANDIERLLCSPNLAIIHPLRTTTNVAFPVGSQADLGEHAASLFVKTFANDLGGQKGEMVGFGWGTLVACPSAMLAAAFAHPEYPYRYACDATYLDRRFGAIRGFRNLPHISEDYAQALLTAEGLKSLGREPEFGVSTSMHYKLREYSRIHELLAARPRWAGGGDAGQLGRDLLVRHINDLGSDSVFMREMRRNRSRYYILAPLAIANVLLTPVLVMVGYTAFAGMALLALLGIVTNQVMTLNGLASYWNRAGIVGGLAIWLRQRLRDALLFAPLLLIEAYGVLESLTKGDRFGFMFRASGGGKMEDYSANLGDNIISDSRSLAIMTWVFGIGIVSLGLNMIAISRLDILNAMMLYPFLLFAVGLAFAPSIYAHRRGPQCQQARYFMWLPSLAGFSYGLLILWLFSMSFGLFHRTAWPEAVLRVVGSPLDIPLWPADMMRIIGCWLVTLLLPARMALVRRRDKTPWRWYNVGVLGVWVMLAAVMFGVAAWTSVVPGNWWLAGALAGMLPFARLSRLVWLQPWREGFVSPNGVARPRRMVSDLCHHMSETARRTALLTLGALIWFTVVPMPAMISLAVFRYRLNFNPLDMATGFLQVAIGIAVLILLGTLSLMWQAHRNRRRFLSLMKVYAAQAGRNAISSLTTDLIESHLEGYRTAVDTRAPRLAAEHLRHVSDLLIPRVAPTAATTRKSSFLTRSLQPEIP